MPSTLENKILEFYIRKQPKRKVVPDIKSTPVFSLETDYDRAK